MSKWFEGHYDDWRERRIDKMVSLFGREFFNNKSILEIGCGHGDIGLAFNEMGANVTLTDGREAHINEVKNKYPEVDSFVLNVNGNWDLDKKYDILIHFGVLYHLSNWKENLKSSVKNADMIFLETAVSNSNDPNNEYIRNERGYDQAIDNVGVWPSASNIEKELTALGCTFKRYDDKDLDSGQHSYSWEVDETKPLRIHKLWHRRFWVITT